MAKPILGFGSSYETYLGKQINKEILMSVKQQAKENKQQRQLSKEIAKVDMNAWKELKDAELREKAEQQKIEQKLKLKYGFIKEKPKLDWSAKTRESKIAFSTGVSRSLKSVGGSGIVRQVAANYRRQLAFDARRLPTEYPDKPRRTPKLRNFFAHGSEMEVYGDEGLTFFDSEKRADDNTGALFGL